MEIDKTTKNEGRGRENERKGRKGGEGKGGGRGTR
jgi:hypothetical protein